MPEPLGNVKPVSVKVTTLPLMLDIGPDGKALITSRLVGTLSTMYKVPGAPPVQLYVIVYVNGCPDGIGFGALLLLLIVRLICASLTIGIRNKSATKNHRNRKKFLFGKDLQVIKPPNK